MLLECLLLDGCSLFFLFLLVEGSFFPPPFASTLVEWKHLFESLSLTNWLNLVVLSQGKTLGTRLFLMNLLCRRPIAEAVQERK